VRLVVVAGPAACARPSCEPNASLHRGEDVAQLGVALGRSAVVGAMVAGMGFVRAVATRSTIRDRARDRVDLTPVTTSGAESTSGPSSRTVSLGGGQVVPYPEPANETATRIGKANRKRDTAPEVRLRSALHRRGLRFWKDRLLRYDQIRVRPDIVFPRSHVAVFVDGCFWHGCPDHQRVPKRNREYWVPKLEANVARDRRADVALADAGWEVIRIWEHEDLETAAERVAAAVQRHRATCR
jgi:DNA mismatch endonuclease (patch repair protein)